MSDPGLGASIRKIIETYIAGAKIAGVPHWLVCSVRDGRSIRDKSAVTAEIGMNLATIRLMIVRPGPK